MRRAFFSLYGLIVLSVLAVGWGLDKLWQYSSPPEIVSQLESDQFSLVEQLLTPLPQQLWLERLGRVNNNSYSNFSLLSIEDFAQSSLLERLQSGNLVAVNVDNGDKLLYKKIADSDSVLSLLRKNTNSKRSLVYDLFLLIFYVSIGLVVFLWVWPLSKDLRLLEKQTRLVGRDQVPEKLHIGHTSAVYDLASAFNRMSQRIRELLSSHKEMTYAVSHELRTPLARMKFALEMAGRCKSMEEMKSKLVGLREDVTEMDSLVNQLLAYAGFEQDDQVLNLQEGDLHCLIEQLIIRVSGSEPNSSIDMVNTLKEELSLVRCEWHLMERALINVIQNAVRHAHNTVTISLELNQQWVSIIVDDDGEGVPIEERERIFQSFVRLQTHCNAQTRGFGLGLAIVNRVLTWHGGTASVTDSPSGGARFILCWPSPSL